MNTTGITNKLSTVLVIKPPMTAMAMGERKLVSAVPQPMAMGSMPAFDGALATAQKAVTNAGAAQSESWIAAQMALSAAERTRDPVKNALADLDSILRTLMTERPSSPDLVLAQQAIRDAESVDAQQATELQALMTLLNR